MIGYFLAAIVACFTVNTAMAATIVPIPLPPGVSPQSAFTFSFDPVANSGDADGATGPVQGYIENAVVGDNSDFVLTATITRSGDAATLGSGYTLLYLVGTDPAFRISSSGRVTFANAIFSRGGSQTLTLVTPGSTAFTNFLFSSNGSSYSGQDAQTGRAVFGAIAAGVPEPSSWALMIIGFGVLGWSMRKRRSAALSPA